MLKHLGFSVKLLAQNPISIETICGWISFLTPMSIVLVFGRSRWSSENLLVSQAVLKRVVSRLIAWATADVL